jgi:hypothetical protein
MRTIRLFRRGESDLYGFTLILKSHILPLDESTDAEAV